MPKTEFIDAWEKWDRSCEQKTRFNGNNYPTVESTLLFESACQTLAAELGIGVRELREELARLRRVGCTRTQAYKKVNR